jgi:hypothetical protein
MLAGMRKKFTNMVNFEHTLLLTEEYAEFLVNGHGFVIEKKEYFLDDHSIFYACRRYSGGDAVIDDALYDRNKNLFSEYISHHQKMIAALNDGISKEKRPIYLFGAHIFSQYLIEFGLETGRIAAILDNALTKQGKRLYGTNLTVHSPKILRDETSPIVILRAGVFNKEIKDDILNNINPDTEFWT